MFVDKNRSANRRESRLAIMIASRKSYWTMLQAKTVQVVKPSAQLLLVLILVFIRVPFRVPPSHSLARASFRGQHCRALYHRCAARAAVDEDGEGAPVFSAIVRVRAVWLGRAATERSYPVVHTGTTDPQSQATRAIHAASS
eukprot:scaffold113110_cov24-Prasinocladus_malaysianus.AAC.1